jgi:hypothetical protein
MPCEKSSKLLNSRTAHVVSQSLTAAHLIVDEPHLLDNGVVGEKGTVKPRAHRHVEMGSERCCVRVSYLHKALKCTVDGKEEWALPTQDARTLMASLARAKLHSCQSRREARLNALHVQQVLSPRR